MTRAAHPHPDGSPEHAEMLAWATVNRFRQTDRAGLDWGAVEGAALLGAVHALQRWDPARGVQFSTYAISLIRHAISDELRQQDHLPRSLRDEAKRLKKEHEEVPPWAEPPLSFEDLIAETDADYPLTLEGVLVAPDDTEAEALLRVFGTPLSRAMDRLKAADWEVLYRTYWLEQGPLELAQLWGVSEWAVHKRRKAALERLLVLLWDETAADGEGE